MDTNTDRDTLFLAPAKVLWDALVRANAAPDMFGFIDVNVDDDGIDPTNYLAILAQHDYDLVLSVIKLMPHLIQAFPDSLSEEEIMGHIAPALEKMNKR